MAEPIPVRVRDCSCPGTPHAETGDRVYLSPTLTLDGGIAAEQDLFAAAGDDRELTRMWLNTFIRYGVTGWDFQDAEGNPLPLDLDVLTADFALSRPLANKASELYAETVLAPFRQPPAKLSAIGPTGNTTSRRRKPTPRRSA